MTINVRGTIVSEEHKSLYDDFGILNTSPSDIAVAINEVEDGDTLEVNINSGGGSVAGGSEIYTLLKQAKNKVVVNVVGNAYSIASIIMLAGDEINISPTAQVMIHDASCGDYGNAEDKKNVGKLLNMTSDTIADMYAKKTGRDIKEMRKLMQAETFLSAKECKELGLVDNIMFEENIEVVAGYNLVTPEMLAHKKTELIKEDTELELEKKKLILLMEVDKWK